MYRHAFCTLGCLLATAGCASGSVSSPDAMRSPDADASALDSGPAPDGAMTDASTTDAPPSPRHELAIGFWCGPPSSFTTMDRYREIAAAGFTFAMPPCDESLGPDVNRRILDYAQANGLQAVVSDARIPTALSGSSAAASQIDAVVSDYASHPGLRGYFVADEPSPQTFPGLSEVVARFRTQDPAHMAYIDLLPNYGVGDTYDAYLTQFLESVHPWVVSYDHYGFFTTGDRPGFFTNLASVRTAAFAHETPFWQIVLLVQHLSYRQVDEAELRWETFHTVAYGAAGVLYFTYWTPGDSNYHPAIIDRDGTPTPRYAIVQRINADLRAVGRYTVNATPIATFPNGNFEDGEVLRPATAPVLVADGAAHLTVGLFRDDADGTVYALFVNRDYASPTETDVLFAPASGHPVEHLTRATDTWQQAPVLSTEARGTRAHLTVAPGDSELYRLPGSPPGLAGPEVIAATVRGDAGTMYLLDGAQGVLARGPGGWNGCAPGYTFVGRAFDSNGFWLCARDDLAARRFYVGNVVADAGNYYSVQGGSATAMGTASWNTCAGSSQLLGRVFNSNGIWVCME